MSDKKIDSVHSYGQKHWVGDGFHVSTLITPTPTVYPKTSPFILLDYAEPKKFEPRQTPYGVGEHPHRGFETVTFAYQGEISHRDSGGSSGVIDQGGVQWMTAGSGVVHEEFTSQDFTQKGGMLEMVQLWVNLPAELKMIKPRYQGASDQDFPRVDIDGASKVRLIAGFFGGQVGPCQTYSPITVFDIETSKDIIFDLEEGTNTLILVLCGNPTIQGRALKEKDLVIFKDQGQRILVAANEDTKLLVLNGQPIVEPIVAHGPFVMNTKEEIIDAINDYQSGKMGHLGSI